MNEYPVIKYWIVEFCIFFSVISKRGHIIIEFIKKFWIFSRFVVFNFLDCPKIRIFNHVFISQHHQWRLLLPINET